MDKDQKERKQDAEIKALQSQLRKVERLLDRQIKTFTPVAGTPTINGHIPMIIEGKVHKVATVA